MATVTFPIAAVGDPNSDPSCFVNILYNNVGDPSPLLITGVQFKNTTSRPALVNWNGHDVTLAADTPQTTLNVSARGELMVQFTNVRGQPAIEVPGGSITFFWPAP